ncbi:MAG: hypothetical protein ACREHD_19315, partial [Pirellulales bacterium]
IEELRAQAEEANIANNPRILQAIDLAKKGIRINLEVANAERSAELEASVIIKRIAAIDVLIGIRQFEIEANRFDSLMNARKELEEQVYYTVFGRLGRENE